MKDSGWIVFVKADPNKAYGAKRFCGNETFWGYKHGAGIGYVQATFKGPGVGTLNFGNCYTRGKTRVYLNNRRIAEAGIGQKSEVVSFNYNKGDVLKITEEGAGIIKINSLKLDECKKEGNFIFKKLSLTQMIWCFISDNHI